MKSNFLSLKQVKIAIEKQIILQAIDLEIAQGDMLAIVGANGAGKTTLIKLLCGILKPTAGEIKIDNNSYSNSQQELVLRKIIGYAPDAPPLYLQDTVHDYLQFIAQLKQVPRKAIPASIEQALEIFDLTAQRDAYIYTLSKGMQQRLNLAQATIHSPQLLIMDEPINALDMDQVIRFRQYLQQLKQQGVTIILASHHYTDLISLCDYMLKVANGTLEKIMLPAPATSTVNIYDHTHHTT